jgi:vitamin B12 transporter
VKGWKCIKQQLLSFYKSGFALVALFKKKTMMRTGIFFVCIIFSCFHVWGQEADSTMLDEVIVRGWPEEKYLAGSELIELDSSLMRREGSSHLGEVLSLRLPIYFRNYGNGMLSSISMRGTSPQHTSVLWNGISINSFSLGQADFSILPTVAFDEIKVHAGAGGARFGSGAIGGTVLLNSDATPTDNLIKFSQEVGSFGRYFTSLNGAWAANQWSGKTKIYRLTSENDFQILATGERQQHAAFNQAGVLQELAYRWSSSKSLSAHYWFHGADRQIQPSIGQFNSDDNQQDQSHRATVRFQSGSRYGFFSAFGGYVNDRIIYNGGPSQVVRWIAGSKHEFTFAQLHWQAGTEWNHIIGEIRQYQNGQAFENRFDFTASIQKNINDRLSLALNLRQPVVSGFVAPFLPYVGADYLIVKKIATEFKVRGNFSKNYRVPTLNDRYWQNAGDINLLPETTYAGEMGWTLKTNFFEMTNTWYTQKVDEWIQWVPQQDGNYKPRNIRQVVAEGFEIKIVSKLKTGDLHFTSGASYQFTKSTTQQAPANEQHLINKQLIYTPQHTSSAFGQLAWKTFSSDFSAQYSGLRFTTSDNSTTYALPAFVLINASVGKYWQMGHHRFDFSFSVKNILNAEYQTYEGRAMPGRNYNFQISYQLKTKSKY